MTRMLTTPQLKFATISIVFSLLFPVAASAQTALQEIRQTGIIKVGIRKDAPPFGYLEGEKWQGVCIESLEIFRADLAKKINRNISLEKVENVVSWRSAETRFNSK